MDHIIVKRIFSLLLALTLILTLVPVSTFAQTEDTTAEEVQVQEEAAGEEAGEDEALPEEELDQLPGEEGGDAEDEELDIDSVAVDITSSDELALALAEGQRAIRIAEDFLIDRTFYITADTVIFTDTAHTLTRAADFGGDIFVIGESAEGVICETSVTLTLGHPESADKDLLTIDGNRDNMTATVTGTVLFVVCGSSAELYENVTITNHKKVGNEKTLTEAYGVSYVHRIGGAVAIITAKSSMDIYGGTYTNNAVNDIVDSSTEEGQASTYGGAFYNYGTLNVYGGLFQGNHASRGGVFYCYRTINIYNAEILENTASTYGGAIYMPSSTAAFLCLGGENSVTDSRVLFRGNTAVINGGAIYARNSLDVQDTQFLENSSTSGSGGAIAAGEMQLTIQSTTFDGNTAAKYGGTIYYTSGNGKEDVYDLSCVDVVFRNNSASTTAGALYMNGAATAYMENVEFTANTAANHGGAVYLNDVHMDIDGGRFTGNSCSANGGAISATAGSSIRLNQITGAQNTAKLGGFVYCEDASSLYIYDSTLQENSSTDNGGAVHMVTNAFGGIYNTTFHKNTSGSSGGALYIYTSGYDVGSKVVLHSCTYTENEGVYGGAIYTAKQSVIDLYNSTAKYNKATLGGFMYHTAYDTTVNLASLILEGNTATTGGPIIYGNTYNAELNLDKSLYIDRDQTGVLDDAYWAYAIANKLTVNEVVLDVPNYIGYDGTEVVPVVPRIPVDIASADELETALESGKDLLHITADFTLDRTFYIWRNTTIYSTEAHTLTRAADFGGDLFVIGERSAGETCENAVTLQLGDPESTVNNLLTIDGNKANMTATVTGSMLFIVGGHSAELYPNLTATNHKKAGNEKTLTGDYGVSYVDNVGGAVAIVSSKASMDIFGGIYSYNEAMDIVKTDTETIETSTHGGAFYNYGILNVYGGLFQGNHASRGGVFYCYRTINIYNAEILENTASTYGGAIYMPSSTSAFLNLGGENEYAQSSVLFQGNSAASGGGAIYAKNKLVAQDTQFIGNASSVSGGAIYTGEMELVMSNTVFEDNTAAKYGAAIYFAGENGKEGVTELTCVDTKFLRNSVSATGGAIYMNGGASAQMENVEFTSNTAANYGGAIYLNNSHVYITGGSFASNSASTGGFAALTNGASIEVDGGSFTGNSSTGSGGVLSLASTSSAVLNKITATENTAGSNGGFIYGESSTLTIYRSTLHKNTADTNGGAIALYGGQSANLYDITFTENTSGSNGGGVFLYTNLSACLLHSCSFTGNSGVYGGAIYASNKSVATLYNTTARNNTSTKGGFLYETTTGTELTIVGVTVSGNTATDGGSIIWGNSTGAKLYLDKSQFTDETHTGTLDDTYWSSAIYNKLTVNDYSDQIPKWLDYKEEAYDHMASAVDVRSADELEAAIASGALYIRVIADFTLDRTFYITGTTTIFSTLPRTLTRAADFGGDLFVVGENADGKSALLLGTTAKLILGNPLSEQNDLLVIDGNKDNMQVPVVGSALFLCYSGSVELYDNVSAKNMHKVGNEKAYDEAYTVPIPNRVGGTLATVTSGTLTIYGGIYRDNLVNEEDASSEETRISSVGGLIFNNSNVYIYGGLFENNQSARGGVIYNYKILRIYGGSFVNNTASVSGGVTYSPSTAASHMHIGSSDADGEQVLFQNNYARSNGGAICSSALCTLVIHGNTTFEGNTSDANGGAVAVYGQLTVRNTQFIGNAAKNIGGAVYTANSNNNYVTRHTSLESCTFENNQAARGGALAVYATNSGFENGAIASVTDCTFTGNLAASTASKSAASYGGAIFVERKSTLSVSDSVFTQNQARTEGGAIYAGSASSVTLSDTDFTENTIQNNGKHGGAVSLHSVTLDVSSVNFTGNTAPVNGGALYISYASAHDRNSEVTLTDTGFTGNTAAGLGGAIYATKQTVTEEKPVLTTSNVSFTGNNALSGGATYFCAGVQAYMMDSTFTENTTIEGSGGAIATSGGILELDTATFTGNTSAASGAGLYQLGQAQVTLYNITAQRNAAEGSGGFAYCEDSTLTLYDSTLQGNTAGSNGGGLALYSGAAANIYNTAFTENSSVANGGGVFLYTNLTACTLHSCTFTGNSGAYGGAVYASGKAVAALYNTVARNNASTKGGFLYHTTTDTVLTIAGVTVSGNTATSGGPIIWGNSTGAVLYLDKSQFVDEDHSGEMDETYWSAAIYNKLTVEDTSVTVPSYDPYVSKRPSDPETPAVKDPVPVTDVFQLSQSSSDADINKTYAKFPKLDNSRNFMSKNVTTFENINGGTVTVDTFVYPEHGTADNCNVGMGLLIWQAMCYKQAFPEEEVYIDVSSYRFSVQAAVNINRNSRYFGYMRQLSGTANYDEYGFVRIAYLLISAAKMGIHVTAIGHIDAYPLSSDTLLLNDYFTTQLSDPCDPAYVQSGIISDYLNFCQVDWSLDQKGGTDMMHTKMCAVSHYLDMNGIAHENAVFSSSSNLDGITAKGENANWKLQTATIVTGHEAIYQTAINYLRLIPQYAGQEEVYEFQNLVNKRSTEQAQLILAGRESEIPAGEQIIYLGRDTDSVFELYFTPMGGDILSWNEVQNPYCKYMRKLYDSEDYILFTWNAAEYSTGFVFGDQLESMLIAAFHDNRNANNRIYGMMENFDATTFSDLEIGVDIGYMSFNSWDFGQVHNKDLQFSYVENGQRYYVSLLNSMNFHSGSMYYQSNFALVIKETNYTENSVFFTLAENSTTGIVEHDYGEEQYYLPEDETLDGYTYQQCQQCDKEQITGVMHRSGEWVIDRDATADQDGIRHRECLVCGKRTDSSTFTYEALDPVELELSNGRTFTADSRHIIKMSENTMPATFEATVQVSPSVTGRGGVIIGNYEKFGKSALSIEVYSQGRIRLYFINDYQYVSHVFATDIRSEEPRHIALTVDGTTASLYVDGELQETAQLSLPLPELHRHFMVGGDYRPGNTQFFKGTIYSVSLFRDVRTAEEIRSDRIVIAEDADALLYSEHFFAEAEDQTAYTAVSPTAKTFDENSSYTVESSFCAGVKTFEATVLVPKALDSAGVILGNYGTGSSAQVFLDVCTGGLLRLYYTTEDAQTAEVILSEDIRSDLPVHIAVTIDGSTATTYLNGTASYSAELPAALPELTENFVIGGDNREGNTQYFRGSIYSVSLFDDVRTQQEIFKDLLVVPSTEEGLLHSTYFVIDSKACEETEFTSGTSYTVEEALSATPYTFEATIQVPKIMVDRAGVIVGNYDGSLDNLINLEIYYHGRVRLYYQLKGGQKASCLFNTDIRSDEAVHIAVTVSDQTATLYVNGQAVETLAMTVQYPAVTTGFVIGGDNRLANEQYFKGNLYSVSLFDHARTPEQILLDMAAVSEATEGLLLTKRFGDAFTVPITAVVDMDGKCFDASNAEPVDSLLTSAPKTIEAILNVPMNMVNRGGVIVGNYDGTGRAQINLEIYYGGKVRLYLHEGTAKQSVIFKTDIRSDGPVHLAVTLEDALATLYVNGEAVETAVLSVPVPNALRQFLVGGDNREGNTQFFKGTIYAVNMFDHVRTPEQIRQDIIFVQPDTDGILYTGYYRTKEADLSVPDSDGRTFTAETPELLPDVLPSAPKTLEAIVNVPLSLKDRAGVIVGNYTGFEQEQINLEIYLNGKVRLFLHDGNAKQSVLFQTDIRSDVPVYLAVTLEEALATLYIDGEAVETAALSIAPPEATEQFLVGGDHRKDNSQYFKGTIYAVSVFDHVRTPEQIRDDNAFVSGDTQGVLYSSAYTTDKTVSSIPVTDGVTFTAERFWDAHQSLTAAPQTIEATLRLPKAVSGLGGTVISNYGSDSTDLLNLEVCADGKLRLYSQSAGVSAECTFVTDIRSDAPVHIAVTVSDGLALLYINGALTEQMKLATPTLTATESIRIGGDHREGNTQFFKGTIYSVYLFSSVRTPEQIRKDMLSAPAETPDLVLSKRFDTGICAENTAGFDHVEGEWTLDQGLTENSSGLMHSTCSLCGKLLRTSQVSINTDNSFRLDLSSASGLLPTAPRPALSEALSAMPKTYEFTLQLPTNFTSRGGVVFGNYNGGTGNFVNVEIYYNGKPRLWFKIGQVSYGYQFKTDIRSDDPVHVALTVDGLTASLYVNGVFTESVSLAAEIPETLSGYHIGADSREEYTQPFSGTIYGVSLFDHIRTPEQIALDAILVAPGEAGLIFSRYFQDDTVAELA